MRATELAIYCARPRGERFNPKRNNTEVRLNVSELLYVSFFRIIELYNARSKTRQFWLSPLSLLPYFTAGFESHPRSSGRKVGVSGGCSAA